MKTIELILSIVDYAEPPDQAPLWRLLFPVGEDDTEAQKFIHDTLVNAMKLLRVSQPGVLTTIFNKPCCSGDPKTCCSEHGPRISSDNTGLSKAPHAVSDHG